MGLQITRLHQHLLQRWSEQRKPDRPVLRSGFHKLEVMHEQIAHRSSQKQPLKAATGQGTLMKV